MGAGPPGGMHQRPQQPTFQGRMSGGSAMPTTPSGKRPQDSRQSINTTPPKRYSNFNDVYRFEEIFFFLIIFLVNILLKRKRNWPIRFYHRKYVI